MFSVTQRIKNIKQPRGGYINPKKFEITSLNDKIELHDKENIHAGLIGLCIDYMTRYMMGTPVEEAFKISLFGAEKLGELKESMKILSKIKGIDKSSIINSCKLVGYDVCFRAGIEFYKPVQEISPDQNTIFNIKTMINRSIIFWEKYGPIIKDGFTFMGGYTDIVSSGDGDYLTKDTLWDFKVSNKGPTSAHTLQLLMYYLLGIHSIHEEFHSATQLGIFNPRLNNVYLLNISDIPSNIIKEVSEKVIGY